MNDCNKEMIYLATENIWGLDYDILEEAYFGSKPEFKEIEKLLGVVIDRINNLLGPYTGSIDDFFNLGYNTKDLGIYSDGTVEKMEKLFKRAFGFKEFHLDFYYANPLMLEMNKNAFTMPTGFAFRDSAKNTLDKRLRGYESLTVGVCVGVDMIWSLQMTPREVMSIILHEIGHNADASIFTFLATLPPVFVHQRTLDDILHWRKGETTTNDAWFFGFIVNQVQRNLPFGAWVAKMNKDWDKWLESRPETLRKFQYISTYIMEACQFFIASSFLTHPIKIVKGLIKKNPKNMLPELLNPQNVFGYGMEKFADSFASSYGYGKEVASTMRKMQLNKWSVVTNATSEIPVINVMVDFMSVMTRASVMLTDPHPMEATRIYRQLVKLERDLKDPSLNPKVRRELEENIADLKKYIDDEILNPNADENKKHYVTFLMNYFIIKVFNGRLDPRELYDNREL